MKWIVLLGLLLMSFMVHATTQEFDIEKFNKDALKSTQELETYVHENYGSIVKFTTIEGATIDEDDILKNPKGGTIDLSTLENSNVLSIQMLPDGGFSIFRGISTVIVSGVDTIEMDGRKLIADGLTIDFDNSPAVTESKTPSTFSHRLTKKTDGTYSIEGSGTLKIESEEIGYSLSPTQKLEVDPKQQRLIIQGDPTGKTTITKDGVETSPRTAEIALYWNKKSFDAGKDSNRMMIDQKKLFLYQSTGDLRIDHLKFLDGELREFPDIAKYDKQVFFTSPKKQDLSNKPIESIATLFERSGYGQGSENFAARSALYNTLGGKKFRGTASQNQELIRAIQNGHITLYEKQNDRLIIEDNQRKLETTQRTGETVSTRTIQILPPQLRGSAFTQLPPELGAVPHRKNGGEGQFIFSQNLPPIQKGYVRYQIPLLNPTQYYTPVYSELNPRMEGASKGYKNFRRNVRMEGSGIYQDKKDQWYYTSYTGHTEKLSDKNRNGWAGGTETTPTLGTVAIPRSLRYLDRETNTYYSTPLYLPTRQGFVNLKGDDGGGSIRQRTGKRSGYNMDVWSGVGNERYQALGQTPLWQDIKNADSIYVDLPANAPKPPLATRVTPTHS